MYQSHSTSSSQAFPVSAFDLPLVLRGIDSRSPTEMFFQTVPERTMRSYSRPGYIHIVRSINARNLLGEVNTGMT
ncbi:hypothetical protein POSPLADRAFT_1039419 [Postia placenta MAD-698-R-SB12]|uniref:Uncharacterized protein n=1 Tax=Postia placenta MAD-698-R-SB12 TaxID=670580 RepID=A0A1X6N7E7_9APHY|nr:hypothetical protein POSPLADRAFT_1039419 [Postia placenta MAD-698-R-SB12]OSX64504.1 hypothetical protein POSPLADRAFT_1039419 [Postia placenta MAD-698-R-SB12]